MQSLGKSKKNSRSRDQSEDDDLSNAHLAQEDDEPDDLNELSRLRATFKSR